MEILLFYFWLSIILFYKGLHGDDGNDPLLSAVQKVIQEKKSIRSAAKDIGINHNTLWRAVQRRNDGMPVRVKMGRPPILSVDEEKALVDHLQRTARQGKGMDEASMALTVGAGKKRAPLSRRSTKRFNEKNKSKIVPRIDKKDEIVRREAFTIKNMEEFYSSLGNTHHSNFSPTPKIITNSFLTNAGKMYTDYPELVTEPGRICNMDQLSLLEHKSLSVPEKRYGIREDDGRVLRPSVLGTGGGYNSHTSLLLSTCADGTATKLWGVVVTGSSSNTFAVGKLDESPPSIDSTLQEMWTYQTPSGTCNMESVASYIDHLLKEKRAQYPDGHLLILIDCPAIHDINNNSALLQVINDDEERVRKYVEEKGGKKGGCLLQYFKHNTTSKCQPNDDDKGINHLFREYYRAGKKNITNSNMFPAVRMPENIVGPLIECPPGISKAIRTKGLKQELDLRSILILAAASYQMVIIIIIMLYLYCDYVDVNNLRTTTV